ncbi:BTB/POZ and TAZ domain-containing protein 4 [Hibiscus syriacus]|uniref:BTB/POZ and TAZ domain-containing protein 4 n=1 Tax=Hibiscus syriacus TaxID=106335 RepID=A0A6A2ZNQ4_HIBSY|nr:BTB/POZ and TAZ domain-containing protein 4-like [Hibiscus syriacus]KAE8693350.1 BTB/POZ and TAZ domain-containing protein 4 [Hibiscus syriacus]
MAIVTKQSTEGGNNIPPTPPSLPGPATNCRPKGLFMMNNGLVTKGNSCVSTATRDMWDNLFDGGFRADVTVRTDNGGIIYAHAAVLGMASPVLRGMLKPAKGFDRKRSISVSGIQHDAVRVFIRFLYSSCYEEEEMKELDLPLLLLSHAYVVPQLKRTCEQQLEDGLLTLENVVDVFQLSLLCDAPRLALISHRMILRNFKAISVTEGWNAMKKSHPALEKEIVESMIYEENVRKEKLRESNERKIYLLLYGAMEALVHICRDGCRTIGPCDKDFKENQKPCTYAACKGIELLVRHFAGCKLRVPGGCIHCKRMWQLLELHARLCADSSLCRVPLCGNFKEKMKKQGKKDEIKWKMLVKKILSTKRIGGALVSLTSTDES